MYLEEENNQIMPDGEPEQTQPPEPETDVTISKSRKSLRKSERSIKEYQYFLLRGVILLLLLWVLIFQIVGLTRMPNNDMSPRLDSGDLLLYYRLDKDVRAQDVIVINRSTPESADEQLFVSRVVAVEGDTVEITDEGSLRINGNTMIEPKIFYRTPRYEGYTEFPLTLGKDECFVLADSRDGGADSRFFGPVSRSDILGTVITIVRRNNL